MALTLGGERNSPVAQVNVTPLIDVLLVLLIIFMTITPLLPVGLDATIPQSTDSPKTTEPVVNAVVVSLNSQHQIEINREPVTLGDLGPRLESIFKTRNERVLFVKGDPDASFGDVAEIIDIARGAGVEKVGLITKAI
jgi:biopolymer transport protein TolR